VAAALFDLPIVTISLIDRDRQWFKSCVGLDVAETSRDAAFCAYTILEDATLVAEDATRDPRFADHPLVAGPPHIRCYAGHPLRAATGERVGTLCVVGLEPRPFSEDDRARLRDLAHLAEQELNRADDRDLRAQLRRADERLWTTLQAIADAVVSFEDDGTIRGGNAAAERMFGARPAELDGQHVDSLILDLRLADVGHRLGIGASDEEATYLGHPSSSPASAGTASGSPWS